MHHHSHRYFPRLWLSCMYRVTACTEYRTQARATGYSLECLAPIISGAMIPGHTVLIESLLVLGTCLYLPWLLVSTAQAAANRRARYGTVLGTDSGLVAVAWHGRASRTAQDLATPQAEAASMGHGPCFGPGDVVLALRRRSPTR